MGAQLDALKTKIQTVADATGNVQIQWVLGDPAGEDVTIDDPADGAAGADVARGSGWGGNEAEAVVAEGVGAYIEDVIVAKLNEVIAQFNQLRADHNSSTTPTTATEVSQLST